MLRIPPFLLAGVALWLLVSLPRSEGAGWQRTKCGATDQITQWGKNVDPAAVLPEYPRPQMTRAPDSWHNLNGLWEFAPAAPNQAPSFGVPLSRSILVPFPMESCLSGIGETHVYSWYRLVFDKPAFRINQSVLLHFGAVDWQSTVWLNGNKLGQHTGGYSRFSFDVTRFIKPTSNELIVYVYDPSENGDQPHGKQFIGSMMKPGGDIYTPSSGIWQTVWLESVPAVHIDGLKITADLTKVSIVVRTSPPNASPIHVKVSDGTRTVVEGDTQADAALALTVPSPRLWSPADPFLYTITIVATQSGDSVQSYFGMRTFTLGDTKSQGMAVSGVQANTRRPLFDLYKNGIPMYNNDPAECDRLCGATPNCFAWEFGLQSCNPYNLTEPTCYLKYEIVPGRHDTCFASGTMALPASNIKQPLLNGQPIFLAGWLDQSYWPDGLYTAPTDEALAFDVLAIKEFGFNMVRMHQKVNPDRWYYHADKAGVIVFQDAVQKYGGANELLVPYFLSDYEAMVHDVYNHPSIVQWTVFNEDDDWAVFNVSATVAFAAALDPSRLVDAVSGAVSTAYHFGDVNDMHAYPNPGLPPGTATQYGMVGEFGGLGVFVDGKAWVENGCYAYQTVDSPESLAQTYVEFLEEMTSYKGLGLRASVYTQIADVELECDGFLNYDRTHKFNPDQIAMVKKANQQLIG